MQQENWEKNLEAHALCLEAQPICDPKGDFYGAAEAYCVTLIYDASQNLQAQAKLKVQARL